MDIRETLKRLTPGRSGPPKPERASPEDVARYNRAYLQANPHVEATGNRSDPTLAMPYAKQENGEAFYKAEFPWLYEPTKGARWDFDPVELRVLSQENAWVGMMVQTIATEIAETSWTITTEDDARETDKRISTHPDERTPIEKDLPDATAEEIYETLRFPTPDLQWSDAVEMWVADYLEVGSFAATKAFPERAYNENEDLVIDDAQPLALQPTPPEVWTKDYSDKSGVLSGFYQFSRRSSPGATGSGARGVSDTTHFDVDEVLWSDHSPRTNRRYGMSPTLIVKEMLQSVDLAVQQEQQYLSRGSIPSGAWVFEEWDREEVKEWKQENEENIKGKPHKSLMFAGKGGDVSYEPMSMNFKELEFTERMKWYARVIASAFQVPTAVVGVEPEKVNYNTFQGERETFETNTLGPYLQDIERTINKDFLSHWDGYRFEFTPGMSETTKQMRSDRVRKEFSQGLRRRNEARRDLGLEAVDEEFDGFQDEVVENTSPEDAGDAMDELLASRMGKAEYEVGDETLTITPPEYMVFAAQAAQDAQEEGLIPDDCGTGVGDDRAGQITNDEVGPDVVDEIASYLTSHEEDVTAEGTPADWNEEEWGDCGNAQYAKWGGTGDGRAVEWAQEKSDAVAELRGEEPTYKKFTEGKDFRKAEGSEEDEPLRNTGEWWEFETQPEDVQDLAAELDEDIQDLYDAVLSDGEIQDLIERMAGPGEEETEKSLSGIGRRLKELLESTDLAQEIEQKLRDRTTEAVRESVENAVQESGEDVDVDVDAVESKLQDRSSGFADSFADRMSEEIRDTVARGFEEGKGSREIAEDIAEQADMSEGWTGAERIARQELHVANNQARDAVAEEAGKVEVWNTSGDNRVRPGHEAMDGTWKRPGEDFVVEYEDGTIEKEDVPGNSKHGIGCRCTMLLRNRDDVDASDYAGESGP